jgi:hypothetical protein
LKKFSKYGFLLAILSVGSIGLALHLAVAAGSATFSLSPSTGSYDINTNFTVTIYENSSAETVNAVQADLSYDASKLEFVSINTSGSAFEVPAAGSGGGGSITIQRGKIGTLTGSQIVGSVTFKVLVGTGSTAVTFANSAQIVRSTDSTDIWDHDPTGGTYTLTGAALPAQPVSGSTSSSSTTGSTTTSKTSASPSKTITSTTSVPAAAQQADPSAPVAVSKAVDTKASTLAATSVKANTTKRSWLPMLGGAIAVLLIAASFVFYRIKKPKSPQQPVFAAQPQIVQAPSDPNTSSVL